ncbi:endoplasmic reticulum junction formation protein lunapark isoform X4 [Chrysemys picta bellii]|uniref:endoplasmic reticulum junction formation protein lunapark isoform X4 n=1 Tax=Chrysemys picta bellii TaxID=8478 RepID=UPI0032B2D1DD
MYSLFQSSSKSGLPPSLLPLYVYTRSLALEVGRGKAKPSTVEVLEKIDKEIQALEEFREKNQRLQKLWVGRLLLYSSVLYLITCLIVYLWYLPDEWTARLIMMLPFFAFPLIIWFIRTVLIFFFSKRTERNSEALEELKSQKKKIEVELPSAGASATPRPGQEIRQRTPAQRNVSAATPVSPKQGSPKAPGPLAASPGLQRDASAPGGPPERTVAPALQSNVLPRRPGSPATSMPGMGLHPPGPPLARPILPRERGALDRVVEYLVGDGPQNRYALICQQCFSHNGMALKEEFEYIAFRCAYCFFLNPARKTRPQAPRLPDFSCEKRQPTELLTTVEPLHSGGVKLQENPPREEPIEQITHIIEADQIDGEASSTEQQGVELSEEAVKEETTNESEPSVTKIDSAVPTEQSEESVPEAE